MKLKILHLEDDPVDAEILLDLLRQSEFRQATSDLVDSLAAFESKLGEGGYDLIISDFTIPGVDPLQALQVARRLRPELPFIFVSGTLGEDKAIETLKLGANDYLLKDRLGRLVPSVKRALREAAEQAGRRQAEVALRAANQEAQRRAREAEKFQFFSEHSSDAHFLFDRQARIRYVNRLACERLGYTREELLQMSVSDISPNYPQSRLKELWRKAEASRIRPFEGIHRRKDGSTFPVEVASTILEVDGEPLIFSVARDITERKQVELALRESERRFRAIFESAGVGIVEVVQDDHFVAVNERACEILGRSRQDLLRLNVHELTWPEDRELSDRLNREVHSGARDRVSYEKRYIRGDGSPVWVNVTVSGVRDDQNRWLRSITTVEDITERKKAEEKVRAAQHALARANQELERKVQQRTAELIEANTNLQTFANTAAHDLRAPLRAINNFSAIVLADYGDKIDDLGKSLLERITESAGQMSSLLNDLLEYSRMSQAEMEIERVSLQSAVADAVAMLEPEIRSNNAQIDSESPFPDIIGHRATVVLIIHNFISNALKFLSPGQQPRVRVWSETTPGSTAPACPDPSAPAEVTVCPNLVRVWIEDNGIGIDPEDQKRLFNVFQRLHSKSEYPGTGLGLAIVRRGAERMGGRVGLISEPGKGSRFWVEFKAAR